MTTTPTPPAILPDGTTAYECAACSHPVRYDDTSWVHDLPHGKAVRHLVRSVRNTETGDVFDLYPTDWDRPVATPDSNVGRWDRHYADADVDMPQPYIDTPTYQAGVDWLDAGDCLLVEDWGAGLGWFAHVAAGSGSPMRVLGIDGSVTPHAQRQADLAEYRSTPEGLFMRGVAEHNWRWFDVLTCAAASFQRRAFVAFFTPMVDHQGDDPVVLASEAPGYPGVPDLALPRRTVERIFRAAGAAFASQTIPSDTAYGTETMYRLWRPRYGPRCASCGCEDHSGDVDGRCLATVADPRPDGEPDQGTARPCGCPTYTPAMPAAAASTEPAF